MSSPASSPVSKTHKKAISSPFSFKSKKVDKDKEAELQSWTTKNARLLRKKEMQLLSNNFRHMLRKEKYKLLDLDLDDDGDIMKKKNKKKTAQRRNMEPGSPRASEILKKLPIKDKRRLANFAKLTPRPDTIENKYIKTCSKYAVVPSKSLILADKKKATKYQSVGSGITSVSIQNMLPLLQNYEHLKVINLSDNPIGFQGARILMSALTKKMAKSLNELILNKCNLRDRGGEELMFYMNSRSTTTYIEKLHVRHNKLTDKFAKMFKEVLMEDNNEKFTDIDLSENDISELGGVAIGEGIKEGSQNRIISFKISWNRLKNIGAGAISQAFVDVKGSLQNIDFSNNNIWNRKNDDDIHVLQIANLVLQKNMNEYNCSHNGLGPIYAKQLREHMSTQKCEARIINVGFNPLGTFETAHIIETMKNNKVRELRLENTCDKFTGGDEDIQYVFELSERVARAKNVLFLIKSRRKVKVNIEVEWPKRKRVQRSKLINSMMGWMNKKRKHKGITNWSGGNKNLVNHGEDWHSLQVGDESEDEDDNTPQLRGDEHHSVFHDRIANCDSHSYWDSQQVNGMAFEEDWCVLDHTKIVKPRMSKAEEKQIHDTLKENFILLRELFMFYAATGNKRMKREIQVTMNGMRDFVNDCQIPSKKYTLHDVDMTFLAAAMDNKTADKDFVAEQKKEYYHSRVEHVTGTDDHHKNIMRVVQHHKMQMEVFEEHVSDHADHHEKAVEELRRKQKLNHAKAVIKKSEGKQSIGAQTLTRTEFLEFIVRLAIDCYYKTKVVQSPVEAVNKLLDDNLIPYAFVDIDDYDKSMFYDRNRFRDEKLYFQEVDEVFRKYYMELQAIYGYYSLGEHFAFEGKLADAEEMDMIEFYEFIKTLETYPAWNLIRMRDIKLAYTFSQMASVKDPDSLGVNSDFVEFLEGIARLADMTFGRGLTGSMQLPLSHKIEKLLAQLLQSHDHVIKKFKLRMRTDTQDKVTAVTEGNVGWQKEKKSKMVDQLLKWKTKVVEDAQPDNDTAATKK